MKKVECLRDGLDQAVLCARDGLDATQVCGKYKVVQQAYPLVN